MLVGMKRPAEEHEGAAAAAPKRCAVLTDESDWDDLQLWLRECVFSGPKDGGKLALALTALAAAGEPDGEVLLSLSKEELAGWFNGNKTIATKVFLRLHPRHKDAACPQVRCRAVREWSRPAGQPAVTPGSRTGTSP